MLRNLILLSSVLLSSINCLNAASIFDFHFALFLIFFCSVFTVFSTSKDHRQGERAMAGCILVDNDKIQVINRSPQYKNKYVHRRTSVSLENLSSSQVRSGVFWCTYFWSSYYIGALQVLFGCVANILFYCLLFVDGGAKEAWSGALQFGHGRHAPPRRPGTNLSSYKLILVWCVHLSILYSYSSLEV